MLRSKTEKNPDTPLNDANMLVDSMVRQHPDLFRDSSSMTSTWADSLHDLTSQAVRTLLIRESTCTISLREYLLSDRRVLLCGAADRLSDACRKMRQELYQVLVVAMNQHVRDLPALLELMSTVQPRAKAVVILPRNTGLQLQQMLHPKVLGYVATEDAQEHLIDAILEVANGRFTASPRLSDIVLRLTSQYLAQHLNTDKQSIEKQQQNHLLSESASASDSVPKEFASQASQGTLALDTADSEGYSTSSFPSSQFDSAASSRAWSGVNTYADNRVAKQTLSEREQEILQLIAGGLSSSKIGQELSICLPTVNSHIRNLFSKLGVHNRAQAIHVGITQGLILVE